MSTLIGNFKSILILILFGIILWMSFCNGNSSPCPEIVAEKVDTAYLHKQWESRITKPKPDTVLKVYTVPVPEYIYRDNDPVLVVEPVDTAAILQDYFAKVVYNDSTSTDYGKIYVSDTISQNRIQSRKWQTAFSVPVVTKTVTVLEKRAQVFAGFGVLCNDIDLVSGARVSLTYKNKKDQQYEVSGNLIGGQWHIGLDTKFKIKFK